MTASATMTPDEYARYLAGQEDGSTRKRLHSEPLLASRFGLAPFVAAMLLRVASGKPAAGDDGRAPLLAGERAEVMAHLLEIGVPEGDARQLLDFAELDGTATSVQHGVAVLEHDGRWQVDVFAPRREVEVP